MLPTHKMLFCEAIDAIDGGVTYVSVERIDREQTRRLLEALRKSLVLRHLNVNLAYPGFVGELAPELTTHPSLVSLSLQRCIVSDPEAEAVARLLKENHRIREVWLSGSRTSTAAMWEIETARREGLLVLFYDSPEDRGDELGDSQLVPTSQCIPTPTPTTRRPRTRRVVGLPTRRSERIAKRLKPR